MAITSGAVTRQKKQFNYPEEYKNKLFILWYNSGKPAVATLYKKIPDYEGSRPSKITLGEWIRYSFREKAEQLDIQVMEEMNKRLVHQKIEMLSRHAKIGRQMQEKALEELERHIQSEDGLNQSVALKLLIDGIRIEKESSGIPDALGKYHKMDDDALINELQKILKESDSYILPPEENNE